LLDGTLYDGKENGDARLLLLTFNVGMGG